MRWRKRRDRRLIALYLIGTFRSHVSNWVKKASKHCKPRAADPYARNPEAAAQLWRLSAQMCGVEIEELAYA